MFRANMNTLHCSFCGKSQDEVKNLIASPKQRGVHICNVCVGVCAKILDEYAAAPPFGIKPPPQMPI